MRPNTITIIFIAAVFLAIAGYDLFALFHWGVSATITDNVRRWSTAFPPLPGIIGAAMAFLWWHFFGQKNKD
jgi:hypothetical protein